jgi:hypothetical protein
MTERECCYAHTKPAYSEHSRRDYDDRIKFFFIRLGMKFGMEKSV